MWSRAQMHLIYIVCLLLTDAGKRKHQIATWLMQLHSAKRRAAIYWGCKWPRPETTGDLAA